MLKYAKIVDTNGLCQVGEGTNIEFYQSIGMTLQDIEKSEIDGNYYLAEKCPHKTEEQKLQEAKENKLNEALTGAKNFIENEAVFQVDENNSIEATDGNIGKLTAYALGFQTGTFDTVEWTTKEDNVITLNQEGLMGVLLGLGQIQSNVWNVQYVAYKQAIEQAQTIEEVNSIEINYSITE